MVEVHYVSTPVYSFTVLILVNPQVSSQRDMLAQDYTVNSIRNAFYKNRVNATAKLLTLPIGTQILKHKNIMKIRP